MAGKLKSEQLNGLVGRMCGEKGLAELVFAKPEAALGLMGFEYNEEDIKLLKEIKSETFADFIEEYQAKLDKYGKGIAEHLHIHVF
jgi:hypothetical protein